MLLSDASIFSDIAYIESQGLNNTLELLTGISGRNSALWSINPVSLDKTQSDSFEVSELKSQIQKYIRAKERLEDAYYFSDDGMGEKEYLEKKSRFDAAQIEVENKLKGLASQERIEANDIDFIKSASAFLLAHKLRAGEHIIYSDFAAVIDNEAIKEFMNLVLDHIAVKNRRVVEIVFANGLSHKFIYRD